MHRVSGTADSNRVSLVNHCSLLLGLSQAWHEQGLLSEVVDRAVIERRLQISGFEVWVCFGFGSLEEGLLLAFFSHSRVKYPFQALLEWEDFFSEK